ncbi:putative DNA-binding domain-containing protein [Plasticicumulans sp.]|uniref:HvfC/BufC family peptide modification chaperone n=1 Tax=Plasticicumulans sp. TaxID=2307179 RepID=UPI0039592A7B
MNLHELQTAFAATLRGREPLAGLDAAVLAGSLSVAERLAIYRNNHRLTLAGALVSAYPVLERLLGCASFAQLAARYVAQTPSLCGDLHSYGATFGVFLDDFTPLADWPWHADLARLEWAVHEAYYAADAATVLSLAELAALPPERQQSLRLRARPSLRFTASRWPVLDLWVANRDDAARAVDPEAGGQHLLIWRTAGEGGDIAIVPVTAGEWELAAALACGAGLDTACEVAIAVDPDCAPGPALGRLLALGVFTGIAG